MGFAGSLLVQTHPLTWRNSRRPESPPQPAADISELDQNLEFSTETLPGSEASTLPSRDAEIWGRTVLKNELWPDPVIVTGCTRSGPRGDLRAPPRRRLHARAQRVSRESRADKRARPSPGGGEGEPARAQLQAETPLTHGGGRAKEGGGGRGPPRPGRTGPPPGP
jgi:hypothetical protein